MNSPLPTVALCPSLEFASNSASKARYAKLTFHFSGHSIEGPRSHAYFSTVYGMRALHERTRAEQEMAWELKGSV